MRVYLGKDTLLAREYLAMRLGTLMPFEARDLADLDAETARLRKTRISTIACTSD